MRRAAFAIALLLTCAVQTPSWSQNAPTAVTAAQLQKDRKVVEKALQADSFAKIGALAPDLERVVGNAPASWPLIDRRGGDTVVRVNNPTDTLAALLTAAGDPASQSKPVSVEFNTYGMAAFLLGSLAVETRDIAGAIGWLDRGLAFQPDNLMMITEKGSALIIGGHFQEALALYEGKDPQGLLAAIIDPGGAARLLRARGYVLIELRRLDEAEAAYKAALELEPDHGGAKAELAYVQKLRAGGPTQKGEVFTGSVFTSDKAKAYKPD